MTWLYLLPLALQGAFMLVDEFFYHQRRGLPLWERVGHPVDTLTVIACFALACMGEPDSGHLKIYAVLALTSCLVITKDEFVHNELCDAGEQWLHSVLFVLHPACLLSGALLWHENSELSRQILRGQAATLVLFMLYQIVYWNWAANPIAKRSPRDLGRTAVESLVESPHPDAPRRGAGRYHSAQRTS